MYLTQGTSETKAVMEKELRVMVNKKPQHELSGGC